MANLKLNSFKKNETKKNTKTMVISLVIILSILASFYVYKTFAYYKQIEEHDVIKTKIGDFRTSEYTSYDNTNTGLNCTGENATAQCAIDELDKLIGE